MISFRSAGFSVEAPLAPSVREVTPASRSDDVGTVGTLTVLQPTTLELTEQRISVIGANGSGKSTLARMCNGLIAPTTGSVQVDGEHDTVRGGREVRRRVGFVFTDPTAQLIMPTAIEDIELSLRQTHRSRVDRHRAALDTLARYGLADLAHRSVHTLSGGQKQLLAIAGVLASGPSILVADEPTTLLDLENTLIVSDLLFSLPQQLIVVTHDLELAQRAERTLVVQDARVAFDGKPAEAVEWYRASVAARRVQHD